MSVCVVHGRWQDALPELGDGDVVVTDPPYGTGGRRRGASGKGSDLHGSKLVREEWDDGSLEWMERASKAAAVCTFWPSGGCLLLLLSARDHGLVKHRPLYLHKPDPMPQPRGRTAFAVEPLWCLSRPGFVLHGEDDWFTASTPRANRDADATGHPYQKPIEFMRWVIRKLPSGLRVVDPFAGSGTTIAAAALEGREAFGVEQDPLWAERAHQRALKAHAEWEARPAPNAGGATQGALFGAWV